MVVFLDGLFARGACVLYLITLSYGALTLLTTGQLPFNVVLLFLLIG